jgi:hypothetical protein
LAEGGRQIPAGYFCISAVSTYEMGGDLEGLHFENLELVPREARTMRKALTNLGLVELFTGPDGELTHEQLRERLETWAGEYDPDDPPLAGSTLVLYSTGHGYMDRGERWRLVPSAPRRVDTTRWLQPMELLEPVLTRKEVTQVLFLLDACFAQDGARDALTKSLETGPLLGSVADVWVVAAARRSENAQQMAFVSAFADALRHHSARELSAAHLDPSLVTDTAASALKRKGATQVPWVAAGYRAGGCRALPNPRFMPPTAPDWIEQRWSAPARGVSAAAEPGWFFTGRDEVLRYLASYLNGEGGPDIPPVLLTGGAGTGKTAVLARLLTTATVSLRRALPAVTRRGYLPPGDAEITALDVTGADVGYAAAELARRLGLAATDAQGVVAALAERKGPYRLMIDHVERAADPAAMVSQFVQPLAAVASARLIVAARPGLATAFPGFRHIDVQGPSGDAESAIEAYVSERLTYYLHGQPAASEPARAVPALASACAGNFSAAVVAVDTLLRQLSAGRSMKEAHNEARRSAYRRLDRLCRSAMAYARGGSDSRYVDDLVACLSAACSYSPDGWLPAVLWAGVARRVNGLPYTAEDVEACVEPALAFLSSQPASAGGPVWRLRYGYVPSGHDPAPHQIVQHLLDEARQAHTSQWIDAHPGVLAILLGAAGAEDGRFASLLDDASLLLAAPSPLVTRALRAVQGRADGRRRIATWAGVPAEGDARERAFLLRLLAARNGLDRLASSVPTRGRHATPAVNWAIRITSERRLSPITRMSLAGGRDAPRIVTAHDDGSVTWWDGSDGRELRTWRGLQAEGRSENVAVASLGAAQTADGLVTALITGDGRALRWGPGDTPSPSPLPEPATMAVAHASGLVALVHGRSVTVIDVISGSRDRVCTLPAIVAHADIGGRAEAPVLWLADTGGRVWRWDLLAAASRQPSAVSPCPPTLLLGCSREGASCVVVDVHGGTTFPARARVAVRRRPTRDVRSVALSERWLVLGDGPERFSGWLEIHEAADAPAIRWPLDGLPVAVGIAGDVLVAATPDGLVNIGLPDRGRDPLCPVNEAGGTQ